MSIRKIATAGEVLSTEEPITKLAAAGQPWDDEDEQALADENRDG